MCWAGLSTASGGSDFTGGEGQPPPQQLGFSAQKEGLWDEDQAPTGLLGGVHPTPGCPLPLASSTLAAGPGEAARTPAPLPAVVPRG